MLTGSASFTAAGDTVRVTPGSTIFVPAHEEHRFHDVTESLEVIVLFAPSRIRRMTSCASQARGHQALPSSLRADRSRPQIRTG